MPNPTEATLAFDGDTCYCLQRRDGKPNTAHARHQPAAVHATGRGRTWAPTSAARTSFALPDGSWWAAGRLIEKGKAADRGLPAGRQGGKLKPALTLPSGGDTSYPGPGLARRPALDQLLQLARGQDAASTWRNSSLRVVVPRVEKDLQPAGSAAAWPAVVVHPLDRHRLAQDGGLCQRGC